MTEKIGVVIHNWRMDDLLAPEDRARLAELGQVRWADSDDELSTEEAVDLLQGCRVGIGSWQTPWPNGELLDACPELRLWVHVAGSVKYMFGPHLDGRDLDIISCHDAIAEYVAEMTVGLVLLGLRHYFRNALRNRTEKRPGEPPRTTYGSTVGIVGASCVGRWVVRYLEPYPCKMVCYDPFLSEQGAAELGVQKVEDLTDLCSRSDVVSLHTPALPETAKMMGAEQFQAMPDDGVFINTARGMCVDEDALITELRKGRLTAYLDVTDPEPAAEDSPLRSLPNCYVTSHIAGPPDPRMGAYAVDQVAAWLQGGRPEGLITANMIERMA